MLDGAFKYTKKTRTSAATIICGTAAPRVALAVTHPELISRANSGTQNASHDSSETVYIAYELH